VIVTGTIIEGSDATTVARVVTDEFLPVLPADVISWTLQVFDLFDGSVAYEILDETSPIVMDTISVFAGWRLDSIGGNFRQKVSASSFGSEGGHTYQFVWTIQRVVERDDDGDVTKTEAIKVVSTIGAASVEGAP
jgi:hypothetical protein